MSAMMRGNLRLALSSVRNAKGRSLLTMLGVVVGIVSVVTVVGLGEGLKRQIAGSISQFGDDLITVQPGAQSQKPMGDSDLVFGQGQAGGLNKNDVAAIEKIPTADKIAPLSVVTGVVQAEGQNLHGGSVLATSSDFLKVINHTAHFGAMWEAGQEASNFVVIGSNVAYDLFGEPAPLGQSLDFRGESFIVIGVLDDFADVPLSPTADFDNAIFIPFQTATRITENRAQAYAILVKPTNPEKRDETMVAITENLKKLRSGQQDFNVLTPEDQINNSSDVFDLLSTWIMAVAAISLLIGGVGLMNIMLVSVTERMHEIGVRKAIGATQRQIMWQFLLEAMVLSGVGGLLGVGLSLVTHGLLITYTDLKPIISWEAMVVAVGVALAVGVVFGTIPAIKAAAKDPIKALRHE
jgi:putative ABC transport system permease protein